MLSSDEFSARGIAPPRQQPLEEADEEIDPAFYHYDADDIPGFSEDGVSVRVMMGEAFGLAVSLFSQSNDKLMAQLQRIEGALGKSMARSDEQLAYYVAQAREIIDLSIMSQKQIVEDLQQLSGKPAVVLDEA